MPVPSFSNPPKDNVENNAPGRVKDIYITFLQEYFAAFPQGNFRFTGNDPSSESELFIMDNAPVKLEVIEKRPALILQRSPMSWTQIALDELKDLFITDGTRRHTDMMTGNVMIHCISREGLEAERLAWLVSFGLKSHRRELQRLGLFDGGRQSQIGAETPPGALVAGDTDSHTVDVPVFSPFYLQVTWQSSPAKRQPFRRLEVRMEAISVQSDPTAQGVKKKVIELDKVSQTVKIRKET